MKPAFVLCLAFVFAGCLAHSGSERCFHPERLEGLPDANAGPAAPNVTDAHIISREDGKVTVTWRVCSSNPLPSGPSSQPTLSANGFFAAFKSEAWNLVDDGLGGGLFLRDFRLGLTSRIGFDTNGQLVRNAAEPSLDAKGQHVAFSGLTADGHQSVFVQDLVRHSTLELHQASRIGACQDSHPALSGDGQWIAFEEWCHALPVHQVYLYNIQAGQVILASRSPDSELSNADAQNPRLSADGSTVVFESRVHNGTTPESKILVFNRDSGQVMQPCIGLHNSEVSVDAAHPDVSADGRNVVFEVFHAPIYNKVFDVHMANLASGECQLLTGGHQWANGVFRAEPRISADGHTVVMGGTAIWRNGLIQPLPIRNAENWKPGSAAIDADGAQILVSLESAKPGGYPLPPILALVDFHGHATLVDVPSDGAVESNLIGENSPPAEWHLVGSASQHGTGRFTVSLDVRVLEEGAAYRVNAGSSHGARITVKVPND